MGQIRSERKNTKNERYWLADPDGTGSFLSYALGLSA